ncbi:CoA transferase [Aromatoleum anaerobium]|uniref:CoA transferase n=2 Tax=Aromatoleum TaxID=551759 RepID=A0ABX1PMT0_9RHOO|nr:CoA transferase [Aromatoleum anaerobium]MCK0508172.1 CoA transferase [Aromatoleum anaerobium]
MADPVMAAASAAPLAGFRVGLDGRGVASDYARVLLASLGADASPRRHGMPDEHPALAWCRSGLMALTGQRDGAPQMCPLPLASCADGVVTALAGIGDGIAAGAGSGSRLLGVRANIAGLRRNGAISPGGSCRLLPTADRLLAVNLARDDDWRSVPAWLETERQADWALVEERVAGAPSAALLERARLLGLAVAAANPPEHSAAPWYHITATGTPRPPRPRHLRGDVPLVVDLSSLWAGPLCGQLLHRLGARVVKVESERRLDGARSGPAAFYDLLNAGKASVRLDFTSIRGRERLRCLIERADIVIEASRPRALRQMGIDAENIMRTRPGLTWISITGHGREEPQAGWIAFGDDAGVGAGLSALMRDVTGERLICGDAIGDPLTGLHAALAAWSSYRSGGGRLLALSLDEVLKHCVRFALPDSADALCDRHDRWHRLALESGAAKLAPPKVRARAKARPSGADTETVFARLGHRC